MPLFKVIVAAQFEYRYSKVVEAKDISAACMLAEQGRDGWNMWDEEAPLVYNAGIEEVKKVG